MSKHSLLETEYVEPLAEQYFVNQKDLCVMLKGDIGMSILSNVNLLELAKDIMTLLDKLIKQPVR